MDDLTINKLCAEAMGWKYEGAIGVDLTAHGIKYPREADEKFPNQLWCLNGGNDWWISPEGHHVCGKCSFSFDPLHDDAQAMALEDYLIANGYLHYENGDHLFYTWPLETSEFTFSADFSNKAERRRAICLCVCVAKRQEK